MTPLSGSPDVLFMNKTMRRKVNTLMRAAGQATEQVGDAFGRPIYAYAGIPIGVIETDKDGNEILPFTEPDLDNGNKIVAQSFMPCALALRSLFPASRRVTWT